MAHISQPLTSAFMGDLLSMPGQAHVIPLNMKQRFYFKNLFCSNALSHMIQSGKNLLCAQTTNALELISPSKP